jgi:dethiobiotin synthetase
MRGLAIVGTGPGGDEREAAAHVAAALRRAGEAPLVLAAFPPELAGRSTPLTAAAHAGDALDPGALRAALAEQAGSGVALVCVAGGLLAPLTPRYAVRDLLRDLGLPLVLAVAADAGAVNLARLSLESARGGGLRVAAVALCGWPEPPDRARLDDHRLLASLAGVPVVLAERRDDDRARPWPAAEWLAEADELLAARGAADAPGMAARPPAARPEPAPAPAAAAAPLVLEPYTAWEGTAPGDPRSTPRPAIMATLEAIVAAEGPLLAARAYGLYNKAAGGRKLTSIARAPLSSAAYWLARERKLVLVPAQDVPWQEDDVLRLPDTPAVRVRELGPRTLDEVPLDEIAELMRRLGASGRLQTTDELKRAVLDAYGLVRLTARADEYLQLAIGLL